MSLNLILMRRVCRGTVIANGVRYHSAVLEHSYHGTELAIVVTADGRAVACTRHHGDVALERVA